MARSVFLAAHAPVLLRQKFHGEMDALELASRNGQIARLLGTSREHQRIVTRQQLIAFTLTPTWAPQWKITPSACICFAAIDVMLLHLEIGNAVAQQPAGFGVLLEHMHIVPGARELLRAGKPRRSRADNRDHLSRAHRRRLGLDPALRIGAIGDRAFDGLDGDRVVVEVERARGFARRRTDAAGHFRKIVGAVQVARGFPPVAAVDEIVPVRDLVVHRTSTVTIGNAAIHAARRLLLVLLLRKRQHEFPPMLDALLDRLVVPIVALEFQKAGNLAHA